MHSEWANLRARCRFSGFAAEVAAEIARRAGLAILRRTIGPTVFYPAAVRRACRGVRRAGRSAGQNPPAPGPTPARALPLSIGSVVLNPDQPWMDSFPDVEVTASLHRWNWLLTADDLSWPEGVELMRSWCRHHLSQKTGVAWEPYSTGERISNACLFAHDRSRGKDLPADLVAAIEEMAACVSTHLEYTGTRPISNHVVNNARALLFASAVLGDEAYARMAYAILSDALPILVREGFLSEGSSHYHSLFTRWLLEILREARVSKRDDIVTLVEPFAQAALQRCSFFIVKNPDTGATSMPLIGDVSPDCSPEWLAAWLQREALSHESGCAQSAVPRDWKRIDRHGFTLFARSEQNPPGENLGHRHNDLASFALYRNGWPVFVDVGRLSYRIGDDDRLDQYGAGARAHNTIIVDGFEPGVPVTLQRVPQVYRALALRSRIDQREERTTLTIEHNGFSRLQGGPVIHTRRFSLEHGVFGIEDRLFGSAGREIETRLHLAPGVEAAHSSTGPSAVDLRWGDGKYRAVFAYSSNGATTVTPAVEICTGELSPDLVAGWYFPKYGDTRSITTLIVRDHLSMSFASTSTLKMGGEPCAG